MNTKHIYPWEDAPDWAEWAYAGIFGSSFWSSMPPHRLPCADARVAKILPTPCGVDAHALEKRPPEFRREAVKAEAVQQEEHPLSIALHAAIEQATKGKGERHGGDSVPFYDQQWVTLAKCHGIGFLTGQAAKKLNEAAQKDDFEAWEREVLGAIVYAGMAILARRGYPSC